MVKPAILGGTPVADLSYMKSRRILENPDKEKEYLLKVFDTGIWNHWNNNGNLAGEFEALWAEYNTSKYCSLVTNGTHALQLALEALDIGYGDEVIVPGITWQATAGAVCDVNAVPILTDINKDTFCIDANMVEKAITSKTRAIICVHLYNRLSDLDSLLKIAERHGLWLIEDCSHCHGSKFKGKGAGSLGTFGTYSFQSSKLMQCAEGGAVLTQDRELYGRIMSLRNCGRDFDNIKIHSGNYRITGFQAAVLIAQLEVLKSKAAYIDKMGHVLDDTLDSLPGVRPLSRNSGTTCQTGYGYAFSYSPENFDGLPAGIFRSALSAELGLEFTSTYTPLNMSEVYYPHLKRRHHLGRNYLESINPANYKLPSALDIWLNRAVVTRWYIFNSSVKEASYLSDAISKIYEHRKDLIKRGI
ncbi:MAG: DegT/DnrJ/EryC1/StrS family aminotransferase [Bacillota bacterium]|nr:DegT/DnrJ/EryC1/StrS family aminotransferase [Bacillota bacterium]